MKRIITFVIAFNACFLTSTFACEGWYKIEQDLFPETLYKQHPNDPTECPKTLDEINRSKAYVQAASNYDDDLRNDIQSNASPQAYSIPFINPVSSTYQVMGYDQSLTTSTIRTILPTGYSVHSSQSSAAGINPAWNGLPGSNTNMRNDLNSTNSYEERKLTPSNAPSALCSQATPCCYEGQGIAISRATKMLSSLSIIPIPAPIKAHFPPSTPTTHLRPQPSKNLLFIPHLTSDRSRMTLLPIKEEPTSVSTMAPFLPSRTVTHSSSQPIKRELSKPDSVTNNPRMELTAKKAQSAVKKIQKASSLKKDKSKTDLKLKKRGIIPVPIKKEIDAYQAPKTPRTVAMQLNKRD